jgi:hypothetical protein
MQRLGSIIRSDSVCDDEIYFVVVVSILASHVCNGNSVGQTVID